MINSIISSVLQIYSSKTITYNNINTITAVNDNYQKSYSLSSSGSIVNASRLLPNSSYPGSGTRAVFIPHINEL